MSDGTKIEWTDATLNVVDGCSIVSPGCTNCYAMRSGGRNLPNHPATGLTEPTKGGHVWTGKVRFNEKALLQPLRWRRPRKIFWNAHGDLFHEAVPDAWIDRCFAVMALTPHHVHQVLTKRPERMRVYLTKRRSEKPLSVPLGDGTMTGHPFSSELLPPPNVWLGVSVEDQKRADERIPVLLDTPAAVRWLSCEPLLGDIDLQHIEPRQDDNLDALTGQWLQMNGNQPYQVHCEKIDWVVAGGESGPGARPMHPDWARSLRDQCEEAGVPFLFKQWGAWLPAGQTAAETGLWNPSCGSPLLTTKKNAGRLLDGVQHNGYPT